MICTKKLHLAEWLKILSMLMLFSFFLPHLQAQELDNEENVDPAAFEAWRISVFGGFSLLGASPNIENNMSASNLNDTRSNFIFTGTTDHPVSYKSMVFDFEGTYFFKRNAGVSLTLGVFEKSEIAGYESIGLGNSLSLLTRSWSASTSYTLTSKNMRHNLFVGPALIIHSIREISGGIEGPASKNSKLGLYAAYSFNVIQKKHFFLALKSNFRWTTKSHIKSYTKQHQWGMETYVSEFLPVDVNLSTINLGLSVGIQ